MPKGIKTVSSKMCDNCFQTKPSGGFDLTYGDLTVRTNVCPECRRSGVADGRKCLQCGGVKPIGGFAVGSGGRVKPRCLACCPRRPRVPPKPGSNKRRIDPNRKEKPCRQCGEVKPVGEFGRCRNSVDGHGRRCRSCREQAKTRKCRACGQRKPKAWFSVGEFQSNACPGCRLEVADESKVCVRCDRILALPEFPKPRGGRLATYCKRCCSAMTAARNKNPDARQKKNARTRRWRKERNDIYRAQVHRNRVKRELRLKDAGSFTAKEWRAIKAAQDYACLCCGRREPEIKLTVDHVRPLSRRGSNTADNLQGLCLECNVAKGTREIDYRKAATTAA